MTTAQLTVTAPLLALALIAAPSEADNNGISWHDIKTLTVEGRGWSDTPGPFSRLPKKAEGKAPEDVWDLSLDSTGMAVRFVTDSPEITVRWKLVKDSLAMPHMPATGVSGVDLYVRYNGNWHWLGLGQPTAMENEARLIENLPVEKREYALYLPLYNGVSSVEIGIKEGSSIEKAPARKRNIRPVVFYGSSITQGACASRPGMAYTAIIGRKLDIPVINLGFSGSGRCEREIADLLAELDPEVYVLDCVPNMEASYIDERIRYALKEIKQKHPNTPVIMVEGAHLQNTFFFPESDPSTSKNIVFEKVYKDSVKDWNGKLYYLKGDTLMGKDGDGAVDGDHPNDLGFERMSSAIAPVLEKVLDRWSAK